jgi:hypothetical protein
MRQRIVGKVHICGWPGCNRPVPLDMWGCKSHWFTLPKEIRDEIWQGYGRGGKLSPAWLAANEKALVWIRGIPERSKDTHEVTPMPGEGDPNADSYTPRR